MDPYAAEVNTEARLEDRPFLLRQRLPATDGIDPGFRLRG
jgi:hypothetical protein